MARLSRRADPGAVTSLIVLIPVSIAMGLVGLGAFFWALRNGQFDDPDGNAWRVIAPEDEAAPEDAADND